MSSSTRENWFRLLRNKHKDEATIVNDAPNKNKTPQSKPQYFSGQFEYEVSPRSSPTPSEHKINSSSRMVEESASSPTIITERMVPVTKTIYLIRHAESDENRRLASLSRSVKGFVTSLKVPSKQDLVASAELLHISAQIDSNVSPQGQIQINQLGRRLAKDDFVQRMGIQLVAHSPLLRARQTSEGMLGSVAPSAKDASTSTTASTSTSTSGESEHESESSKPGYKKAPTVGRVVELDLLSERTPVEWLPTHHDKFTRRIAEFEHWLSLQPEDVIAIVGHSQYFKSMLGLEKKFKNCDVWSLQFDYHSVQSSHTDVKHDIKSKERDATQRKVKKTLQGAFQFPNQGQNRNHRDDDEVVEDHRNTDENGDDNNNIAEDSKKKGKEDHDGNDNVDKRDTNLDTSVYEDSEEIYEIDGVRVDDVELPRGWRELKRHYTFDPALEDKKEGEDGNE